MKKALIAAACIAAIVSIAVFLRPDSPEPDSTEAVAVAAPSIRPVRQSPESTPDEFEATELPALDALSAGVNNDATPQASCLNFRDDPSHPWFVAEMARLESLVPEGSSMAVYRGLSESDLKSLAEQKDSGAMVVLGRRAELRADGKPERDAVEQLDGQNSATRSWRSNDVGEVDVRAALEEAEYWYYQAALHGRLYAMPTVGVLRMRLYGGAVEQGWIDEDVFTGMTKRQRADYQPGVVYGAAATSLVAEVIDSPMLVLAFEGLDKRGDPPVVELVVNQFHADLQQHGLTLPTIPPYKGPSLDEWRTEFCRGD